MDVAAAAADAVIMGGGGVADAAVLAGRAASSVMTARGGTVNDVQKAAEQGAIWAGATREQAAAIGGNMVRELGV